ncbi:hypothetical protein Y032_0394g624 [Ancylostoma ceylanicum]|uniref:Uncharacterized protein n=1 Tax=Ancylostoma ceylanicum TaxID=53326 RepID=A0A016RRM7_9BILA|nr:hypothetical protein Y032_0394g624 [Ancylostoma ceylanicum]
MPRRKRLYRAARVFDPDSPLTSTQGVHIGPDASLEDWLTMPTVSVDSSGLFAAPASTPRDRAARAGILSGTKTVRLYR